MADISRIQLPSGSVYDIKDAVAREAMSGAIKIKGTTTTILTDEGTTNPIIIGGQQYTAVANDAVFYNKREFVFDGTMWHEFGDMSGLGALASKDSASANYTPAGTVSAPTISIVTAGTTTNITNPGAVQVIRNITSGGTNLEPGQSELSYYSVTNETLTFYPIGYSTGDSIITGSEVTVKTGDATYSASAPVFTGTTATITST